MTTRPHWTRPRIRAAHRRYRRDLLLQATLKLLLLLAVTAITAWLILS